MNDEPAEATKPLCILLVEDDALIGELLTKMLMAMGHKVCPVAVTEADAVIDAAVHHPDLMLVDAQLGNGSGIAAITEILQTHYIPHVFMSGNLTAVHRLRPDAITLLKPFDEAMLAAAMQAAMATGAPPAQT